MYDSILSNVWRRVRRYWLVLAIVAVIGGLLGAAFSRVGGGSETARFNFRFTSLADVGGVLDLDRVTDVDVNTIANQARLDYELTPAEDRLATTFTGDGGAHTVTVTVTGATRDEVLEAADQIAGTMSELAVKPRVDQANLALKTVDSEIDVLRQQLADIDDSIDKLLPNDVTLPALLLQRLEADRDLVDATTRRANIAALRDYATDSLMTRSEVSFNDTPSNLVAPVAGAFVALILALFVILGMVLTDRRVRRRMHLEDAAPEATVLGIVVDAAHLKDDERAGLVNATREFVRRHHLARLVITDIAGVRSSSELDSMLNGLKDEIDVITSDLPAARATALASISEVSGYVVRVRWGKTSYDQLSAALASIRSLGDPPIGLLLDGVPRSELDWAGVSAHGTAIEMAS